MADPSSYRPAPGQIPTSAGVYRFRDEHGTVIYVGKAKNLRNRLSSYFVNLNGLHTRTRKMVTTAASVDWTVVNTEVEALQLEFTWIKKYNPTFNVRFKDDKSYPFIAVSVKDEFPRVFFYRGQRRRGNRYFGPYSSAWAVRDTLDTLTQAFPARSCSASTFNTHAKNNRPCLLAHIDKCSAPCVGKVDAGEHREIVTRLMAFLGGKPQGFLDELHEKMQAASAELEFEEAARVRDRIGALESALEKQSVVLAPGDNLDIFHCAYDELEIAVYVFNVRNGRILGQSSWIVEHAHIEPDDDAIHFTLVDELMPRYYGELVDYHKATGGSLTDIIPAEILAPTAGADTQAIVSWLEHTSQRSVTVRTPVRGDKHDLYLTAHTNADEAFTRHKVTRSADITARSTALNDIASYLDLPSAPLRIECVDISHLQGSAAYGSLVVFQDGLSKKSDYRSYKIKEAAWDGHSDDVASIKELLHRRCTALTKAASTDPSPSDGEQQAPNSLELTPDLLIIDGGKPQVNAAYSVLEEHGLTSIPVVGIAKRLEELWLPGESYPVIIPRSSSALFLIQRLRDEAHRFAITKHRNARSKNMTMSQLDQIPGVGPAKRAALLAHFGSLIDIASSDVLGLQKVPGIGPELAAEIVKSLHSPGDTADN